LLERYDVKLDEVQEAAQVKEMQLLQLCQQYEIQVPEIVLETLDQKIEFLQDLISKLLVIKEQQQPVTDAQLQIQSS